MRFFYKKIFFIKIIKSKCTVDAMAKLYRRGFVEERKKGCVYYCTLPVSLYFVFYWAAQSAKTRI